MRVDGIERGVRDRTKRTQQAQLWRQMSHQNDVDSLVFFTVMKEETLVFLIVRDCEKYIEKSRRHLIFVSTNEEMINP